MAGHMSNAMRSLWHSLSIIAAGNHKDISLYSLSLLTLKSALFSRPTSTALTQYSTHSAYFFCSNLTAAMLERNVISFGFSSTAWRRKKVDLLDIWLSFYFIIITNTPFASANHFFVQFWHWFLKGAEAKLQSIRVPSFWQAVSRAFGPACAPAFQIILYVAMPFLPLSICHHFTNPTQDKEDPLTWVKTWHLEDNNHRVGVIYGTK